MQRFKKILLVYDGKAGERSSLERAVALAKSNRAELTLVDVIEELPGDLDMFIASVHPEDVRDAAVNERQGELEEIIRPVKDEGIQVSANVFCGRPFIEIIKEVLRSGHDLVIKNVEAEAGKKEILFGTTTMPLMRKCPCPVWVLKPSPHLRFLRILAAVNPLPMEEERNALNRKIMDLAVSLSELEESELHVVHTSSLYYEDVMRNRLGLKNHEVDRIVKKMKETHRAWVEELVQPYSHRIPSRKIHILRGDAGKVIPEFAMQKEIDLIVMGTVGRSGVSGLFIGNTAEKVLQNVDCSVMAVKPDGFVSPVKLDHT
jgi:nucleotide-binding universal stress UspA family protein